MRKAVQEVVPVSSCTVSTSAVVSDCVCAQRVQQRGEKARGGKQRVKSAEASLGLG